MEPRKGPIKVPVRDKRRGQAPAAEGASPAAVLEDSPDSSGMSSADAPQGRPSSSAPQPAVDASPEKDFKDLYLRSKAELENERKRFKAREGDRAVRAIRGLVEALLPALDNFERAIAHGEGGEGVALVFKQLSAVLEAEGLVEIAAEGAEFDPNLHEAMESRVQEGLEVPTVIEVHRRGYMLGDQLLRAALVVVGHPEEPEEAEA